MKLKNEKSEKQYSYWESIFKRFKKNKLAVLGVVLFIVLLLLAIFANSIVSYDKAIEQNMPNRLQSPSFQNILGTDEYGRDEFARIVHGSRISLIIGLGVVILSIGIGSFVGAAIGYYGGRFDMIMMRFIDVLMAIPGIILFMAIMTAFGNGVINIIIAISVSSIPRFIRIIRSSVMSIKDAEFIEAAKITGCSTFRIIVKHILPNVMGPVIVQATLNVASVILMAASLSYLGLGINPPTPEWGSMMAGGEKFMRSVPHLIIIPGIFILLTTMAMNLMGDGLRDALDPKLKK